MTDIASAVITGAVAGALSPATAGRPPEEVIIFALLGSVVAVWLESKGPEALSWAWAGRTIMLVFTSVLAGVVGSALLQGVGEIPLLGGLARVERWITACIIAALIHRAGPLLYRAAVARARKEEGTHPDASNP